ncbi:MAG: hypothetical protein JRI23_12615, partial [Deltaproteobacteria bacterium]|nr:hypothetical protein [Deltaproteobacteria bacterium]MBW2532558.1 hypothetical protein [Deltaproteobacteria bacterium]
MDPAAKSALRGLVIALRKELAGLAPEVGYGWANRLLALRCMEAQELCDEVVVQRSVYGGRSLEHYRFAQQHPERCAGDDDGLYAVLEQAFQARATDLPQLFGTA